MDGTSRQLYGAALAAGVLLAPVRVVAGFFPVFNLGEIVLFGGAAALAAYVFRAAPSLWCALLALPALLLILHMVVFWLGPDNLRRGVGVGHALSLVLIPASTVAGAHYGGKLARRHSPAR